MTRTTIKSFLMVTATAVASITSLALPTARVFVATIPQSGDNCVSCLGVREMFKRSHAQFGEAAADLACFYLKKFNAGQELTAGQSSVHSFGGYTSSALDSGLLWRKR